MSRPPLDSSDETVRLDIRIPKATMDTIDEARGDASRSAFIRALIRFHVEPKVGQLKDVRQEPIVAAGGYTEDPPALTVPTMAFSPEAVAEHRHRRGELLHTFTVRGNKTSTYRCAFPGCTHEMKD